MEYYIKCFWKKMYSGKYGREPLCCKRKRVWIVAVFSSSSFLFFARKGKARCRPWLEFRYSSLLLPFSKRRGEKGGGRWNESAFLLAGRGGLYCL